jgi:aldehyde dehydrogenase (NAD+)
MLATEPLDHLIFTGSTSVGREIAAIAADRLLPTTLELSGRDSAFVLSDADPALAARSIWNAVIMNAGQTCMAPRRVLVEKSIYAAFLAQLAPLAAGARPRRLIDSGAAAVCFALARDAVSQGGRSLSGVLEDPRDALLVPLAIADCPPTSELARGEHFGPVLSIIPVPDTEAALHVHAIAAERHTLATSIFTRNQRLARSLGARAGSGIVTINDCILPTGDPRVSIRGTHLSGWGASRGADGLLALTRPVHITQTSSWLRLPTDTPTTAAAARLGRFMLGRYGKLRFNTWTPG